jgi:hypothetical protein
MYSGKIAGIITQEIIEKKKKLKSAQTPLISSRYFLSHNVYEGFVNANFYITETFKHAEQTVPS